VALKVIPLILLAAAADTQPAPTNEQIVAAVNAPTPPGPTPPQAEEAPPPLPRHHGVVVESSLGALGFLGQFRHLAPTAPWLRTLVGYEVVSWFMPLVEAELAFTDTSVADDPSKVRAFPIFGFFGGGRFTLHFTERFAGFAQGTLGLMKADVPNNAFAILGYSGAERLGTSFGGRVGLEWYQVDRHMALGIAGGLRDAGGFAETTVPSDNGLMWDAARTLRYTF
jgi:hypothetical protein